MKKDSGRYKWVLVGLLWGVALLNYMDRQMLAAMRPAMQADIHELQSATMFGYLMGIFLWIYGLVSPVGGMVADRFNRKWLIVISLFVWSGVTYGMGLATTFRQLYWLRAVMGISESLYIPAGLSLIADFHGDRTRSLAIGIHMTGIYCGQALGGFGATIAGLWSWHATFHSFGLAGMAYSLVLILFLKEKKDKLDYIRSEKTIAGGESLYKRLALLFSSIPFWIILVYFAVPSLPGWAVKNWLPTLFAEGLNIPMTAAGPLSTISIAASSLLGVLFGGFLSDRWIKTNIRGRIYTSAIGLSLTIPALLLIGFGHSLFFVAGAALCFGVGWGMYDANNMPILCQFVPARYRATAYGIMNMAGVFSGAYITDLLGGLSDAGRLGSGFAMLAVIVLLALAMQLAFLHPKKHYYA
jgi:MFS family permease